MHERGGGSCFSERAIRKGERGTESGEDFGGEKGRDLKKNVRKGKPQMPCCKTGKSSLITEAERTEKGG